MSQGDSPAHTAARYDLKRAIAKMIDTFGKDNARSEIMGAVDTVLPEEEIEIAWPEPQVIATYRMVKIEEEA